MRQQRQRTVADAVTGSGHAQVAAGGAELGVAEQLADAVQVHAGFQQMGREAVPQRVDAADLGNACGIACGVEVAPGAAGIQRLGAVQSGRKYPVLGASMASASPPVQPQLLQQFGTQQAVAVVPTLAGDDADAHAVGRGVDVAAAQVAQLAHAHPRRIGRHQEGAGLEGHRRVEHGGHLGSRQHLGQPLRRQRHGDARTPVGLAEHLAHQKAQGAGGLVDAGAGQVPITHEVQQVRLQLLVRDQLGAAVIVAGHLRDDPEVGLLGTRPKAAQDHRIDHALTQRCHRRLRVPGTVPGDQATTYNPALRPPTRRAPPPLQRFSPTARREWSRLLRRTTGSKVQQS